MPCKEEEDEVKRISLEDLKALIDEPCEASCIDVDNTRRLKDEEVRDLIIQQCGAATEEEFQKLERESTQERAKSLARMSFSERQGGRRSQQQESIIHWLREEGSSVRQIVSHTGFTTKQVRNLTDKKKE